MICKTQAIAVRFVPVSETSRMVQWITPDFGRMATLIKGAQRPKSPFLGQYDLFQTCELLFYFRPGASSHIARECAPLARRDRLRGDWRAAAAASYFCDLVARACPPDAAHPELFALLNAALDHLARRGCPTAYVPWFEMKLLEQLGLAPRLRHCLDCGRDLLPARGPAGLAHGRGGFVCAACRTAGAAGGLAVAGDTLALLGAWQRSASPRTVHATRIRAGQQQDLENILGLFLRYHLDLPLPSRAIALDLLHRRLAPPAPA